MEVNKSKKFISAVLSLVVALGCVACVKGGEEEVPKNTLKPDTRYLSAQEYSIANLTAVDDYGRTVEIADPSSDDKYVGMFYFAWLGNQSSSGCYDVNELEKLGESSPLYDPVDATGKSPSWQFHFASEPLYGYYSMNDEWVITRHMELFTMAGLDYILFDYTNAVAYNGVATKVLEILRKFKSQGWKVPGVGFYTNSGSATMVRSLYQFFYKPGTYDDLWFRFKGDERPVIVGVSTANLGSTDQPVSSVAISTDSEEYNYFNFYESQWPSRSTIDENKGFPWMKWGPPAPHENGFASVSVAQHSWSSTFYSSMLPNSSRGYDGAGGLTSDWKKGSNYQWQWDTVMRYNEKGLVKNIFLTGWNEWTAIKYPAAQYHTSSQKWAGIPAGANPYTGKEVYFVDEYNAEYSRDIELGKVFGDNFYMQTVQNLRKFKMKESKKYKMSTKTISDISDLSVWENVFVEYADFAGDAIARDGENAANVKHSYIDNSNRNDIVSMKVIHDSNYLYVCVNTLDDITAYDGSDEDWMNLFISTGDYSEASFAGFNYLINRKPKSGGKTSVEKCTSDGFNFADTGEEAEYYVSGKTIVYKVPLSAIGLKDKEVSLSFKVTDNVQKQGDTHDILDYYISGDSAPIGRFGFGYNR